METARRAQKAHRAAQLKHGEEREAAFDSLSDTIEELDAVMDALASLSEEIALAVRWARFRFWLGAVGSIAAIISAVAAVAALFLR